MNRSIEEESSLERLETHAHRPRTVEQPPLAAIEAAAGFFRAAGDVSRLRLLTLLRNGEWCVSELAETLCEGLSTVSQRLKILRSEGLVARRRDGKHVLYSLADAHVASLVASAIEHAQERLR